MIPGLRLLAIICDESGCPAPTRAAPCFRDAVDRLLKVTGPGL